MTVRSHGARPTGARSRSVPITGMPAVLPRIALLVAAVLGLNSAPAAAVRPPDVITGAAISIPGAGAVSIGDEDRAAILSSETPWRDFTARNGAWTALWNTRTGSPHRAFGQAIPLPGFADDAGAVEAAVRDFISAHTDLFGTPTLEASRVQRVRGTWYVSFRQTVAGLPILFSDWEFRVGSNGNLFAFGADAHRVGASGIPTAARLPAVVAREAARSGMPFVPGRDRIEGGDSFALLPVGDENGLTYRVVAEARVVTVDPPGAKRAGTRMPSCARCARLPTILKTWEAGTSSSVRTAIRTDSRSFLRWA